jgi:ketosteroid isomerase-like protein
MNRFRIGAVCLAAVVAGACGTRSTALTDADREAIRTASASYVKADDGRDADAMMAFVAEGAIYMPSNSPMIVGREAIRTFLKPHAWDKITQTPAEIEGRDGIAYERGSYTVLLQGKTYTGFYLDVWARQPDGAWKVTRKIWNSDK